MKKLFLLISVTAFAFASCTKDDANKKNNLSKNDMLVFENLDDFSSKASIALSMSESERPFYENSKDYVSFGRKCDEVYNGIDFDSFKTQEELIAFVKANSKYLEIIEDEDGELCVETRLSNNIFRYLVNEDKMFEIDGTIYKAVNEGMVSTTGDIEALKKIDDKNLQKIQNDTRFSYTPFSAAETKTSVCGGSWNPRDVVTNDRDRIVVEIEIGTITHNGLKTHKATVGAKPQKKALGMWHKTSRTTKYNFVVAASHNGQYGTLSEGGTEFSSKVQYELFSGIGHPSINIDSYDCMATTPSVHFKYAHIRCGR